MKQRRQHPHHRLGRDAERLVWLAKGLADSGSRVEDDFWEGEIDQMIAKLLAARQEDALNQALDRLYEGHANAYGELADLVEAAVEGGVRDAGEGPWRVLLVALPVLAWSRYAIPARPLAADILANLRVQLAAHVLAEGVRVSLADFAFSPDQLPQGFIATRRFADRLWDQALKGGDLSVPAAELPETGQYISDLRYILAAVAAPVGRPIFRWNEADGSKEQAEARWADQAGPSLQAALPGCSIQPLLPDAFFSAWRRADRDSRAFSLIASVAYLQSALDVPAAKLRAIAAPYYDVRLVEWRVGFGEEGSDEVLHGVTWPLLGAEDEGTDIGAEIKRVLVDAGVTDITLIEQRMPLEYCEDCGAPLFPNADGESVHAEMPEQDEASTPHLH